MRHSSPIMTAAFVWAMLAGLTVRAQQMDPSGREPITQSLSTGKTAGGNPTRKSSDDQFYGMATSRGARYLLRNGLDYLNYKEYERALKFLREVETRKDELNSAEKLILQKGIESAQRGLRQAAGTEYPYALTERSRNRRGFSAADPETHIAEQRGQTQAPTGTSKVERSNSTARLTNHSADDRGEPIRLASGNIMPNDSNSQDPSTTTAMELSQTGGNNTIPSRSFDRPRQFPDIRKLPTDSQGLNEPDGSPLEFRTDFRELAVQSPEKAIDQVAVSCAATQDGARAQESSRATPRTISTALPSTSGTARSPALDAPFKETSRPKLADMEAMTPLPPAAQTESSGSLAGPAHKETEETSADISSKQPANTTPTPAAWSSSRGSAINTADDLPPLPNDLANRVEPADSGKKTPLTSATNRSAVTGLTDSGVDALPPLPGDVSGFRRKARVRIGSSNWRNGRRCFTSRN